MQLKKEVLDKIKSDPDLFSGVAKLLGVSPSTLPNILNRNDSKLTQISVLKFLAFNEGVEDIENLIDMQAIAL
jgi:hypothetical protein